MARGPICNYCDEKLAPKQAFCGKCGHPTEHASHDERVLWDLGQWEVSRRRKATSDPKAAPRAAESAARTKELFRSAQGKASSPAAATPKDSNGDNEAPRRSFLGRVRREPPVETPQARPAAPPERAPQAPAARPAASTQARPPARPNGAVRPAASTRRSSPSPAPSRDASNPAARRSPTMTPERLAASRSEEPARRGAPAASGGARTAAAVAPATRPVERREYAPPRPATRAPAEAPLVVIRKAAAEADAPAASVAAPAEQAPAKQVPAKRTPAKPSRAERRAAEEKQREAEGLRKQEQRDAARLLEEQKNEEERRRKDEAKDAKKRESKHRRHSKRVNRRAAELDLRNGERVSLSIEGWSRFRRATLVVTNYRVALVTQMPAQVRWIPLEEVNDVHHRWRGAHSLIVTSPIEILTLQKSKRQMLDSFEQLLGSEVAEARRPGSTERHHGDITQEWAERSTEIWDSHLRRLRLWIRRHPAFTVGTLTSCVVTAFVLTSLFTSLFSPYR